MNSNGRFLCLEVSDKFIGNTDYWKNLAKELEAHRSEFLWEMLNRDISKVQWDTVPMSKEALNQIEQNKEEWRVFTEEFLEDFDSGARKLENDTISVKEFYEEYWNNACESGVVNKLTKQQLSRKITTYFSDRFEKVKGRPNEVLENIWKTK